MQEVGMTRSGLKMGYTTGSCAAASAKAAAYMLLSGEEISQVRLMTPKGITLILDVESVLRRPEYVTCAVRKYSGDDPDVTDGILVYASVTYKGNKDEYTFIEERDHIDDAAVNGEKLREHRIRVMIDGGTGVGRVTKAGLEQRIGQAAVNKVPRKMIADAVAEVCRKYKYSGDIMVTVFVPDGEQIAQKTFNPRLGIRGGLSILGTTGIVEPMSEKALTDTIYLEMKVLRENNLRFCYVVPGNYGMDFLKEKLKVNPDLCVKCSNYVGETIDYANLLDMEGILLIGHAGKFIKLAAGVMNTHSRMADCRMEVFASHAAIAGAGQDTVRRLMKCISTSEAVSILKEQNLLKPVMKTVMERISFYLKQRAGERLKIGAVVFTDGNEILGKTEHAWEILEAVQSQEII